MKTAEEVAKEIVGPNIDGNKYHQAKIKLIAQALTAYTEEGVNEDRSKHAYDVFIPLEKYDELMDLTKADCMDEAIGAIKNIRAETLEEAAQIAGRLCGHPYEKHFNYRECVKRIRALKDKP